MSKENSELHRGLKARHLQLIALGGIIGSGYFLGTGLVIQDAGPGACLAYILGGLIVFAVMYSLGELAVHIPISSSFITYANEFISPSWACGVGWSYWVTWISYVPSEMIAAGLIMNQFAPILSAPMWAILFGVIVTIINLFHVESFGELEFWFALIKILAILVFCSIGIFIFFGYNPQNEFLGFKNFKNPLPKGIFGVLLTMVIILVNFQGSEIIGLAAGESKNPEESIPIAIRNVAWRILALYVIPVFLLVLIVPWKELSIEVPVFSYALERNGFSWAASFFSFVVLTAAISCSSSGLYGCSRALFALSEQGMAPRFLKKLNKNQIPQNATLLSLLGCWIGILAYSALGEKTYQNLLALSGFSGAIAWISICWSQYNFRKKNPNIELKFKMPFFPYFTLFGIWSQVLALILLFFNEDLRIAFYLGVPILVIPILIYHFLPKKNI
jgi:AAT family amino acid transporter